MILVRKYQNRFVNPTTVNQINNTIKYKNFDVISNENQLYEIIVKLTKELQEILRTNMDTIEKFNKYHGYDW